jgi:hypothetical protein
VRRILSLIVAAGIAASMIVLAAPAGAQTGDVAAACAGRIEGNTAEGKKANLAIMNKVLEAAPASLLPQITAFRDAYAKKGDKLFNSDEGFALLGAVDAWMYENCPGTKVQATAIDYEFQGVPATLPAGDVQIQLTNDAPQEEHEMGLFKLTEAGAALDPEKLLAMPEKKLGKYVDFSTGTFMFAPPGQVGYGLGTLTPGEYVYACFIPVGGKKKGAPHFTQGMYGTLTVS